jgi:hypothetical protein
MNSRFRDRSPKIRRPFSFFILSLFPVLNCGLALCQEIAFTSRTYIHSPVLISSVAASKDFGFDSVTLRNDGPDTIGAIHFQIAFRTPEGDETAGERRVVVSLAPRESKRVAIGLAQIEGLRQKAESAHLASALVILTIESVEFENGSVWKQIERDRGITLDPLQPQQLPQSK